LPLPINRFKLATLRGFRALVLSAVTFTTCRPVPNGRARGPDAEGQMLAYPGESSYARKYRHPDAIAAAGKFGGGFPCKSRRRSAGG